MMWTVNCATAGYAPVGDDPYRVAIKLWSPDAAHPQRDFDVAAEFVSRFHHQNVVELIGVCPSPKSMIFEYMYVLFDLLHVQLLSI